MQRLLMIALAVAVVAAFAMPAVAERKAPQKLRFELSGAKTVEFSHGVHEQKVSDCKTCHHMGVGTGACRECHGVHPAAPNMKRAMHKSCRSCHTKMRVAKARDCGFCHK